jgi:hypothetical protein
MARPQFADGRDGLQIRRVIAYVELQAYQLKQRKAEALHPGVDVLLTVVNAPRPEVQLGLFLLRRDLISAHPEKGTAFFQIR